MAPIIKILRGHAAPPTLEAGRIAIDQTNKNLYVGIDDGAGGTINEIVGGSGTFATKTYVDSAVAAFGTVFRYAGDVSQATGNDLDTLPDIAAGAYYRVDVAGVYTAMVAKTQSFDAKVGDAFVQTTDGWQKLDNVDAEVLGTANEIAVTGDENAGYTVAIDPVFSGRVSTAETEIDGLQSKTQNIDLAGTTAGTTKITGNIVGSGTNSITDFIIDGGEY